MDKIVCDETIEKMKENLIAIIDRATFQQLDDFLVPARETLKILEDIQVKRTSLDRKANRI